MARQISIGGLTAASYLLHMANESMRPKQDPREEPILAPVPEVPPRECGTCTLCCKTFANYTLNKPPNTWCQYACSRKSSKPGCGIYDTRPAECRGFSCLWLLDDGTIFPGEAHRPDRVGIVIDPVPGDLQNSFVHPLFRVKGVLFLRVTQQYGGAWRTTKARNSMQNCVTALPDRKVVFVIDEGLDSKTILMGDEERTLRPFEHALGKCWTTDDWKEKAIAQLDRFSNDEKYMANRAEAFQLLDGMSMAERGMAAQLENEGFTYCLKYQYDKVEAFAAFLRRRTPDRTFEVEAMDLPDHMKQFDTEGHD